MHTLPLVRRRHAQRSPRRLVARGVTAGLAAMICLAPQAAFAKPTGPQLSIAVTNGHTSAAAGERLAYTVTVTNLGGAAVNNLWVTQSVPAGANFGAADAQGQQHSGAVTWRVKVKASGTAVLHTTMTVAARTPQDLMRLATVTCAKLAVKGPPLVCASDSDQLPAGAAQEAATVKAARTAGFWNTIRGQVLGAGVAAVAVSLLVALLMRRRKA